VYFCKEDQSFNKTDILLHCAGQTLEDCAIEFETKSSNLRTLIFRLQILTNLLRD
jgi:hypothetical protein